METCSVQHSELHLSPRYNIAPTQSVPVILEEHGLRKMESRLWGLIPFWAREPGRGLINARSETVEEKPSFRHAFRSRRCLIPASGFYEWKRENGRKQPYYIRVKSGLPMAFAGLWEQWNSPDGEKVLTCAILTVSANALMEEIHQRMPVIVPPSNAGEWLGSADIVRLQSLMNPFDPSLMEAWPVSTRVNKPTHDKPECITPLSATHPGPRPQSSK